MTTTESDRLLAAGVPLQLAGGEARLRFDLRALKRLEDHYGNLADAATALTTMYNSAFTKLDGAVLSHLETFLAAGLPAELVTDPTNVLELLDATAGYRQAMVVATAACYDAWVEAFPMPSAEGKETAPAANGSDGPTSTGSSPASPADPTSSSGG